MRVWRFLGVHAVVAVVLLAAGVRISYVAFAKGGRCAIVVAGKTLGYYHSECTGAGQGRANDQVYYNAAGNQLADGKGFTSPFGRHEETADHPPVTVFALAGVAVAFNHLPLSLLADETHLPHDTTVRTHVREDRYFMALLGTLNVLLIMLLARRLAGRATAIGAGVLAALYPYLWVNDGLIFSETIAITCVLLTLLLALRCAESPRPARFAAVGAMCAVAALARAELLLLAPLLVLAIAWVARRPDWRVAVRGVVAAGIATVAVLAPWFVYNAGRFHARVLISTNDGLALAGSNCAPVYHGADIGLWNTVPPCVFGSDELDRLDAAEVATAHRHLDQSEISGAYRHKAVTYMRDHLGEIPVVVAARVGRAWSLFRPLDMISYNAGESRERWVTALGLVAYYPLLALALVGAVAMMRRRAGRDLWFLIVPAISVTAVAAATYGQTRLRATGEPSLVILGAIGGAALIGAVRARRRGTDPGDVAAAVPVPRP